MAPLIIDDDDTTCSNDYSWSMVFSAPMKPPAEEDARDQKVVSVEGAVDKSDPFLYYSDDETRMRAIRLIDDGPEEGSRQQVRRQRKTRISFEVHPSLVLDDDVDDVFDDLSLGDDDELDFDLDFDLKLDEADMANLNSADLFRQLLEL